MGPRAIRKRILKILRSNYPYPYYPITQLQQHPLLRKISHEQIQKQIHNLVQAGELEYNKRRNAVRLRLYNKTYEAQFIKPADLPKRAIVYVPELDNFVELDLQNQPVVLEPEQKIKIRIVLHNNKRVLAVLEEGSTKAVRFVGNVERQGGQWVIYPQGQSLYMDAPFAHLHPQNKKRVKQGDKVLAKVVQWHGRFPEAIIIKRLGKVGEHETEIHAIIEEFHLPKKFPEKVLKEAEALPDAIPEEEYQKRKDFRDRLTFTIDPEDAKDFDDALSFKILDNGLYEVGVHIADVSWYVAMQSALDKEAYKRGTSVYLVDRTIPMLPPRLSSNLCSLVPQQDRLTVSVVFHLDDLAQVRSVWMGRTIIHSNYRLTYEEAQKLLEQSQPSELGQAIKYLHSLAQQLRKRRLDAGSIAIEEPEVRFELDPQGKPLRIFVKKLLDTNRLIEDFMLLANRTVAKFLSEKGGMIYRVHDYPYEDRLKTLQFYAAILGHPLELNTSESLALQLNRFVQNIKDPTIYAILSKLTLRSMTKAVYSTTNIGHFGLGFRYYTHFTSPIRRYPDLVVHRILMHLLENKPVPYTLARLERIAKHSSERERVAMEAERASIKYKQVEWMEQHIGEVFEGRVSGVAPWGVYVELTNLYCEGLIHASQLPHPQRYDEKNQYFWAGKLLLRLGQKVKVRVIRTDLRRRHIDFHLEKVFYE